jgi:hypothetical protein
LIGHLVNFVSVACAISFPAYINTLFLISHYLIADHRPTIPKQLLEGLHKTRS